MAQTLEIDLMKEAHLLWVARLACMIPLAPQWESIRDSGEEMFLNQTMDVITKVHPGKSYIL